MGHNNLLLVAIITLLVAVATMAQPAQKRVQPRGIWGMETDYSAGLGIKRPRAKTASSVKSNQRRSQSKGQVRPKSIGGGAAGGALVGGVVTPRRTRIQ